MVELLLQAGASPVANNLMTAIGAKNVAVALLLVAHGVDVKEPYGLHSPLHFAAKMGNPGAMPRQEELIRALLDAGAPVDARTTGVTRPGVTPLMSAANCGYTRPRVLRLLLKYGSDVDAVDAEGRTAEDHAHHAMQLPVWHEPHDPPKFYGDAWRGAGVVEGALALFRDYRAAGGTWKRYANEPRKQLLVLRRLVERGRAAPPDGTLARVQGLPDVLFWKVLAFWRSDRDV